VTLVLCAANADVHLPNLPSNLLAEPGFSGLASNSSSPQLATLDVDGAGTGSSDTQAETEAATQLGGLSIQTDEIPEFTQWRAEMTAGTVCLPALQVRFSLTDLVSDSCCSSGHPSLCFALRFELPRKSVCLQLQSSPAMNSALLGPLTPPGRMFNVPLIRNE
jgi:hypothetical protein